LVLEVGLVLLGLGETGLARFDGALETLTLLVEGAQGGLVLVGSLVEAGDFSCGVSDGVLSLSERIVET
jgi:hypothetical protein